MSIVNKVADFLKEEGYAYRLYRSDESLLQITLEDAQNGFRIVELLLLSEAGPDVQIEVPSFFQLEAQENRAECILLCNRLNQEYRWVKFILDENDMVQVKIDSMLEEENCGMEVFRLIHTMEKICEKVYGEFARLNF